MALPAMWYTRLHKKRSGATLVQTLRMETEFLSRTQGPRLPNWPDPNPGQSRPASAKPESTEIRPIWAGRRPTSASINRIWAVFGRICAPKSAKRDQCRPPLASHDQMFGQIRADSGLTPGQHRPKSRANFGSDSDFEPRSTPPGRRNQICCGTMIERRHHRRSGIVESGGKGRGRSRGTCGRRVAEREQTHTQKARQRQHGQRQ